jgi:hypothetical protein
MPAGEQVRRNLETRGGPDRRNETERQLGDSETWPSFGAPVLQHRFLADFPQRELAAFVAQILETIAVGSQDTSLCQIKFCI